MLKDFSIIVDAEQTQAVAQALDRYPWFAIDLETTGLDFMRDEVHGVSLATDDQEWYVTLGAEQALWEYLADLSKSKLLVGHNISFDLHWLWRNGVRPTKIADTMIGQFLVDENQALGLKSLGVNKLGYTDLPDFKDLMRYAKWLTGKRKLEDVSIHDMPFEQVAEYAGRDTRLTHKLWPVTEAELRREDMTDIFWNLEMPFIPIITEMEHNGFFIDQALLQELGSEFTEARDDALNRWMELSGDVNPASNPQLATFLYETLGFEPTVFTDTGKPAVNVLALTRLKPDDETGAIEALLTYRKYDKLIGTYITAFMEKLYNGRLNGNFNQLGDSGDSRLPRTGRLSSSNPNLQNIPARGDLGSKIRALFTAPPGRVFVDADYSQLELRILAHYTKDANLLRIFAEGGDPHQLTVDLLTSLGYDIDRRAAKAVNFGTAYRIGPRGLQDSIETQSGSRPSEADAKAWLEGFDKAYPAVKRWQCRVIDYARDLGYVRTIAGRRRRLPDINSKDRALSSAAERQACNVPIQGSAADIIKWAMIQMAPALREMGVLMTAQVHDEVTAEAPEQHVEEAKEVMKTTMEEAGRHFELRVGLVAEPHSGPNWAATH